MSVLARTRPLVARSWWLAFPVGLALGALACSGESADPPATPGGGSGGGAGQQTVNGMSGTPTTAGTPPASTGGNEASAGSPPATAGAPSGGMSPTAGAPATTAGAAGTGVGGGGNDPGMDTPAPRAIKIDMASARNERVNFTAKDLDPMAGTSKTDTNAGATEHGQVDTRKPIKGKLVLTLGGIGTCCGQGGIGGFAVGLGFHEMGIAMQTKISSAPDEFKKVPEAMRMDEQNRQMGDARMEAFDGKDRVTWLDINEHDSLAYRTALALKHMMTEDAGGDWGYFLNADGSVRWSDVYFVGYSYGSQTLAVIAKYVPIGRGIATSGPVDEGFPNATWIKAKSVTPPERMFGLFGSSNLDTKVMTTTSAGWLAPAITLDANATTADLKMGHLFILNGEGHGEFCAGDGGKWKALCNYSFGAQ